MARLAALLFLMLAASALSQKVLVLTDDTLADALSSNDKIMVEFYAPWCGHCKALAPEYDAAAASLGARGVLAKVDCTTNEKACEEHGADSYPTIKWFTERGAKSEDYTRARTAAGITAFVLEQSRPAVVPLAAVADATAFVADTLPNSQIVAVVLSSSSSSSAATDDAVTKELADLLRADGFALGAASSAPAAADIARHYGVAIAAGTAPTLLLFKNFNEDALSDDASSSSSSSLTTQAPVLYAATEPWTSAALHAWCSEQSFPLYGPIGPDSHKRYTQRGLPLLYFFLNPSDHESVEEIRAAVAAVAPEYRSLLSFVHADGVRYAEHAKTLGVTSAPGVVLHHGGKAGGNAKYVLRGLISERTLRAFVENWRAGKLPKFVRSQPVPKKQSKAVKVVVGKSVAEVALDPTKDVIVEFFAPWCGECKKFGPILEKWAASMATEDPNLVVAAMDHTQNDFDLEGVSVTAYPTVYLFPAGDAALKRAPRVFEGDRTAKGLAAFLRDVRQERDAPKAPELPEQQQVMALTAENFDESIKANPFILVKFYAPWCGHCKKLAKPYAAAAQLVNGRGRLAKVDCDAHAKLCERFEATSYPTLKFFANGKPVDYEYGRSAQDMAYWVVESSSAAGAAGTIDAVAKNLSSNLAADETPDSAIAAFIAQSHATALTLIARVPSDARAQALKPVRKLANALRMKGHAFAYVVEKVAANAGDDAASAAAAQPVLEAYQAFDDRARLVYDGAWKFGAMSAWIKKNSFPLVGAIGPDTETMYRDRGLPLLHMWVDDGADAEGAAAVLAAARALAREPEVAALVSIVQADFGRYGPHAQTMGCDEAPCVSLVETAEQGGRKYLLDAASLAAAFAPAAAPTDLISTDSLRAFVRAWNAKKLKPYLRSAAPVPKGKNREGKAVAVREIVGTEIETIAKDTSIDVFVEAYAPWCGQCKKLAPKYEALAKSYAGDANMVIAALDATENDIEGVKITGYPTLLFYAAGSTTPEKYDGDRETEAMRKWLERVRKTKPSTKSTGKDEL